MKSILFLAFLLCATSPTAHAYEVDLSGFRGRIGESFVAIVQTDTGSLSLSTTRQMGQISVGVTYPHLREGNLIVVNGSLHQVIRVQAFADSPSSDWLAPPGSHNIRTGQVKLKLERELISPSSRAVVIPLRPAEDNKPVLIIYNESDGIRLEILSVIYEASQYRIQWRASKTSNGSEDTHWITSHATPDALIQLGRDWSLRCSPVEILANESNNFVILSGF